MECRPIEQERPNLCPSGVDVFCPASRPFDPGHRAAVTIPCCLGRQPSIPELPPFRICCSWPCRFYLVHPQPLRCWLTRRTSSLRAPLCSACRVRKRSMISITLLLIVLLSLLGF